MPTEFQSRDIEKSSVKQRKRKPTRNKTTLQQEVSVRKLQLHATLSEILSPTPVEVRALRTDHLWPSISRSQWEAETENQRYDQERPIKTSDDHRRRRRKIRIRHRKQPHLNWDSHVSWPQTSQVRKRLDEPLSNGRCTATEQRQPISEGSTFQQPKLTKARPNSNSKTRTSTDIHERLH